MKLILSIFLALAATAAQAIMPPKGAKDDAKRFGLDRAQPKQRRGPSPDSARAFRAFNANQGGHWKVRFSPRTGLPAALTGGSEGFRRGTPDAVSRAFLAAHGDILGIDPATLTVDRQTQGNGHKHVLYRQNYKGIPVEFSAVKVHIDANGSVIGVHSAYEPILSIPTTPSVASDAAVRAAIADAGGGVLRGAAALAIVPLEADGKNHLTWKLRIDSPNGGAWRYYVDAVTGQVLFRFSVREFACAGASGVINGNVFDIDPSQQVPTPGTPVVHVFKNQTVYVGSNATPVVTDAAGSFCSATPGKVALSLQGPFVSVSQFRGPSANYDNGSSSWSTIATPVSSPHPYPNNANIVNTISIPGAAGILPVFNTFSVGSFGGGAGEGSGDIVDDDRLMISDGAGHAIANYIGARGAFNGAAVHGPTMKLTLKSNDSGQEDGYDIAVSSYMTMTLPDVNGAAPPSPTWTFADTWISGQQGRDLHGEISLFYHLNLMHDYFTNDVDATGAAPLNKPVVAMAHVGPKLINAFYDPDYDDLSFGDIDPTTPLDAFMDDATVPHHEYTHYVVQKIWDIQNYGQAGTLSEANADYWSASSLNDPAIGTYVIGVLCAGTPGCGGPLRQIDEAAPGAVNFVLGGTPSSTLQATWTGEIHSDSPFLSQALWDIRKAEIVRLGAPGRSCADGLVFQSLLYFPESFSELYEDMNAVNNLGAVPNCGGAGNKNAIANDITAAFNAHGIAPIHGDAYEPNDGFETAADISTIGVVSATIFPMADTDFYSFGAGSGLVQITMQLPNVGGGVYKNYQLKLYNASRQQVAGAAPPANTFGNNDGVCDLTDCGTTSPSVSLSYNNPAGGLLYVQVIGGDTGASNSGVNSTTPYILSVSYPQNGALSSSLVSAKFDRDTISFTVNSSTFISNQDWRFSYAQLRDQSGAVMPNTLTNVPPLPVTAGFLAFVSSSNAYGQITGSVQLVNGFAARFPSVGTVGLEVFAYDVHGSTSSMGVSNKLNLSDAGQSELTAYNNLFNPLTGRKSTVKYAVASPGHVTIKLYTETGRLVATLFDGDVLPGKGSVDWNGMNSAGRVVASGIYVVHAVGPGLDTTQKIAVIK